MPSLLTVDRIGKTYKDKGKKTVALQEVSLHLDRGECLGVVGESGSGKSTLSRILLALERPDQGDVYWEGKSLFRRSKKELLEWRQYVQMVFQDPTAALNQRLPVWKSVIEPLDNFPSAKPSFLGDRSMSRKETAGKLLEMVGLHWEHLDRYPHELSGGQRQRVAIARGISLNPKLLICDEPTSSLDVSAQVQILQLLKQMKEELGMACLFISHDIATVRLMSDRMIVMKDGSIVDEFASHLLLNPQRHAYTRRLVEVVT